MTVFDILNDIMYEKKKNLDNEPDFEEVFDHYMVLRWLSMSNVFVKQVAQIEPYSMQWSKKELYRFLCDVMPKKKVFLKYIKKPKVDNNKNGKGKQKQ